MHDEKSRDDWAKAGERECEDKNTAYYVESVFQWDQLRKYILERELCCSGKPYERVSTDQLVDVLCCSTNNAAHGRYY